MNTKYKPPLAIHFIWHPSDKKEVDPILDIVRTKFARDVDYPFSRGLNIPLFFYSSECSDCPPSNSPKQEAEKDVVFIFTSVNTLGNPQWKIYIDELPFTNTFRPVPIAISEKGLGHSKNGQLKDLNFLRIYEEVEELRIQIAMLAMAHEIYRHGFVEINPKDEGRNSSIKIFISHSKTDKIGLSHAQSVRKFIDNTNMSHFFDAIEISPGFKFNEEIIKHIKKSTLIAIGSDSYSSRYWCQREILCAKENRRPIIAVDCLDLYEDRVFPAAANVPCIHVSPEIPLDDSEILRILIATILETLRIHHAFKSLEYYKNQGWINKGCEIIPRPPEIRQIIEFKSKKKKKVCYPEPPLYIEEADWLSKLGVEAFTPLWNSSKEELNSLKKIRIGISISDFASDGFTKFNLHGDHLKRFAQDLARHLLARCSTIIYGGDLRKDGFTQFILDEAIALKNRLNTNDIHVENHLAWPLYISEPDILEWRATYNTIMETIHHNIPKDLMKTIDAKTFLAPNSVCNKYKWSRCLTEMREESIRKSDVRICAGGKLSGYNGKMPGVLEEIIIAIKNKPIYLLGGFGGVVSEVCKTITNKSITETLTEAWQVSHNTNYFDLQNKAKQHNHNADYEEIKKLLENISINTLAKRSGLKIGDYKRLMYSPFVDECIYLIIKGLKKINIKNSSSE